MAEPKSNGSTQPVKRDRSRQPATPPCLYLTPSVCNNLKHLCEPSHPNTDEPQRLRHQHKNKGSTGSTRRAVERNQSVATPAAESVGSDVSRLSRT